MRKLHSQNISFKKIYEEYFDRVYTFLLRRVRHKEEAKDLTQDIFVKVYKNWKQLEQAEQTSAYLFSIARNTLIDYYRKSLAKDSLQLDETLETRADPFMSDQGFSEEQVKMLYQSIELLPEQRREIIKLKKLQGYSTEEIAEQLSISKRTVENQIYRAMTTLRKHMANLFSLFF